MENIMLSVVVGIASSLVATGIFISISEIFRKVLIPWYADKVYKGVRIDGDWTVKTIDGNKLENKNATMQISLHQKGEKISGTYLHKNDKETDEYYLEGRVRDLYFLATAVPKSNRHIDGLSFLMHINVIKSNLSMSGGILCQGGPGEVNSHQIVFHWRKS